MKLHITMPVAAAIAGLALLVLVFVLVRQFGGGTAGANSPTPAGPTAHPIMQSSGMSHPPRTKEEGMALYHQMSGGKH